MKILELIQKGQIKRYFKAREKLNYPGLVSHITQRAAGKGLLFVEEGDCLYMLKLLKETSEDTGIKVFSFCLMPNHVHILLKQTRKNLSESMHKLFMRYAVYFNRKYGRIGHLFCGAFRQASCFDDYYLLAASLYIHLNPVRAGIVDHYSNFSWSTWRLYCQPQNPDTFVDYGFILGMLNKETSLAKEKYKRLLDKTIAYRGGEVRGNRRAINRFSGWLHKNFPGLIAGEQSSNEDTLLSVGYASDKLLEESIRKLKDKKRLTKPGDIQARKYAVQQLRSRGFSSREIADYLDISHTTVYTILSRQ